jgi:hypothetical protein
VTDLTDERLRDFAASDPLVLAICATMGDPSWAEVRQNAAELLAARAELRRLRAIEANARDFARKAYTSEAVASFDALKAALAAKEKP